MTQSPLRCHLLIGPPGSGKTTLARDLAPLLKSESGEPALVLSTDAIRAELFGDAGVQGPWEEIRTLMLQRLKEAVEWIGWWLTTPLPTCLEWAARRERAVARLLHVCGGLYFGKELEAQLAIMPAEPSGRSSIPGREWFETLRFSCTPHVFALIHEEPNRFPPEHTAYSRPIREHHLQQAQGVVDLYGTASAP